MSDKRSRRVCFECLETRNMLAVITETWIGPHPSTPGGPPDASYYNKANWSGNVVPLNTRNDQYDVIFDASGGQIVNFNAVARYTPPPGPQTVDALTVEGGDVSFLPGTGAASQKLNIAGSLTIGTFSESESSLSLEGGMILSPGSTVIGGQGSLATLAVAGSRQPPLTSPGSPSPPRSPWRIA